MEINKTQNQLLTLEAEKFIRAFPLTKVADIWSMTDSILQALLQPYNNNINKQESIQYPHTVIRKREVI